MRIMQHETAAVQEQVQKHVAATPSDAWMFLGALGRGLSLESKHQL